MHALKLKPAKWMGLFAIILSSCASADPPMSAAPAQSPPPASNGNASDETDVGSNFDNLDIVDVGLKAKLAILRVGSEVGENNLLSVFAGLKNKTAHQLDLEVQTIYQDKAGNALNSGSWIPLTLKPHEEKEYRSTAISEQAVDFLIRVQRAQTVSTSSHK
jgi:hypothetical protein